MTGNGNLAGIASPWRNYPPAGGQATDDLLDYLPVVEQVSFLSFA
jgi:hypothetical protein